MGTLSALLALYEENPPVTMDSPHKVPVMRSFDVSFVVGINKLFNKQSATSDVMTLKGRNCHAPDLGWGLLILS